MFFPETKRDARRQVAALIAACPLHQATEECPLEMVRRLSSREQAEWLWTRSEAECAELCRHHAYCFMHRTGDL